jgi:hypothetical protein
MDDYGVEEFKSSSADSKTTQDKTPPIDEAQKTSDKLGAMKIDDAGLYKQSKKPVAEVDEDAMYSQEPDMIIENTKEDHFAYLEQKKEMDYEPKDTFFVFMGEEFLYLDFKKDTWAVGDVNFEKGKPTFSLP